MYIVGIKSNVRLKIHETDCLLFESVLMFIGTTGLPTELNGFSIIIVPDSL